MKNIIIPYALSLTSGFTSPSLLKARIVMLYQKPSAQWALTKFGFALPVLLFCMLITAFTQRESLLEMSIQTWEGFQREMREAYNLSLPTTLPAVAKKETKENDDIQKRPAVLEKIAPYPLQVELKEENRNRLKQNFRYASLKNTNNYPKFKGYAYLNKRYIHAGYKGRREEYVFTGENKYLFCYLDPVTLEVVDYPVTFYLYKKDGITPMQMTQVENAFIYQNNGTAIFDLEVDNSLNPRNLLLAVYYNTSYRKSYFDSAQTYITTHKGKVLNTNKPISMKNGIKVMIKPNADKSTYRITSIYMVVFRAGKALHQAEFKNNVLDFSDIKVQKGDAVQLTLGALEKIYSDGKIKKVYIAQPYIAFFLK